MAQLRPPDDEQQQLTSSGDYAAVGGVSRPTGGTSSFVTPASRWTGAELDLGLVPPPPPPEPPGEYHPFQQQPQQQASLPGDSGAPSPPSTGMRVQALVGKGAAAATVLASGGAALAKEAARSVQGAAGVNAEQVELIGLGIGLTAGLGCLCCLRCACRRPSRRDGSLSRGQRARRALSGMTSRSMGGRRAVPVDDYDDDLDDDFDDEDDYGYDVRDRGRR